MAFSISLIESVEKERLQKLEQQRIEMLNKTIEVLKSYFSGIIIEELYITGSLLVSGKYYEHSDIDIAIKGLPIDMMYKTIFELEEMLNRKVEIIELENCIFKEKIIKTGLKLQ